MDIGNAHFKDRRNGGGPAPRQVQWEYRTAIMDRDADLTQFGSEGWELVSVAPLPGDDAIFYFKRRRQ